MSLYRLQNNKITQEEFTQTSVFLDDVFWIEADYQDDLNLLANKFELDKNILDKDLLSSKYDAEGKNLYMQLILYKFEDDITKLEKSTIKLILKDNCLITISNNIDFTQDIDLNYYKRKAVKKHNLASLTLIIKKIINKLADMVALVASKLEESNMMISKNDQQIDYKNILTNITIFGDVISKIEESSMSVGKMLFSLNQLELQIISERFTKNLKSTIEDLKYISEHINFLSSKISFLLDTTFGLINLEQNNIIKIFSISSVIFMPPTLIASIYGMNFKIIPELSWQYGYIWGLSLMILSAWIPYKLIKNRNWL